MSALKFLNVRDNQLMSIPAEIGQLQALEELVLSENHLKSIPAEIGKLNELKELYLQANQLTSIPPEIGQLKLLKCLNLHKNQFTSIPIEIGRLISLKKLYLFDTLSSLMNLKFRPMGTLGDRIPHRCTCNSRDPFAYNWGCIKFWRKKYLQQISWSEQNHYLYPKQVKRVIFTPLMIGSVKNGIPVHSEAGIHKFPREILYIIFGFIYE